MDLETLKSLVLRRADAVGAGEQPVATGIDGFSIVRARQPTAFDCAIFDPILCLVLQGAKRMHTGERELTFSAMQSIIVSVGLPALSQVVEASPQAPYLAVVLRLDPGLLSEMVETLPQNAGGGASAAAVERGEVDSSIIDAMGRLAELTERPAVAQEVLAPLIRREIHFWLAQSRHGPMIARIVRPGGRDHKIARAVATIRQGFSSRLQAADLARQAGMSLSAFHAHFRALTGTSPLQYQKSLRLIEARRLLRTGAHSVATAAFAVGYESPTQFSREYSRLFGEAPRAALRQPEEAASA